MYLNVIKVIIEILDINDDRPAFVIPHLRTGLSETSPLGTRVMLTTAVDRDSPKHGIVGYTLVDSEVGELFKLKYQLNQETSVGRGRKSGIEENHLKNRAEFLAVELVGSLDRETVSLYFFTIVAWDSKAAFQQNLKVQHGHEGKALLTKVPEV